MDNECLCLKFPELLDYVRDMLDIADRDLARRLGVTAQMITKWRRGDSLPQHETILKLFDLMEMKELPPAKLDWGYYIDCVLDPTDYEVNSEIDEVSGTVMLQNIQTGEVLQVAVSDVAVGRRKYENYQRYNMGNDEMIRYRLGSSMNKENQRRMNLCDSFLANPITEYNQAEDFMNAVIDATWNDCVVLSLKKWIAAVKKNPHIFADKKYSNLAEEFSRFYSYTNKDLLRDEIVEDPELFDVLVGSNIYAFRNCGYRSSLHFVFDIFVEEMKYKDNRKRIKKYVDALFQNENARAICSWVDFVCEVIKQLWRDCHLSDINHKAIDYLLEPFKSISTSGEEREKLRIEFNRIRYPNGLWIWRRVKY